MSEQINKPDQEFFYYSENGVRLGIKRRSQVHHDGSWHRGVQINLIYQDCLLLQRRSEKVDIAKGLLDQSLATQLIVSDHENDMLALKRGLITELGIRDENLKIKHVAGPRKIVKRYDYDKLLYNREFVTLYQAELSEKLVLQVRNPKISGFEWMSIGQVKQMAINNPKLFTKTFIMWLKEAM